MGHPPELGPGGSAIAFEEVAALARELIEQGDVEAGELLLGLIH